MATGPVKPTNITNPLASTSSADRAKHADKAGQAENVDASRHAAKTGASKGNYDVKISPEAKEKAELQKNLFEAAKMSPDIREDRVADLKKRIAEGTYNVDAGSVADSMLREAVRDHLAITDK